MKSFSDLSEQEIIALAISSEDDDARAYSGFAHALMDAYPASAKVFIEMSEEEHEHRRWLTDLYRKKFGDFIPLIRRSDIIGFVKHKPAWTIGKMNIEEMRKRAEVIEFENYRFYKQASERSSDPQVKTLLNNLAEAEKGHESLASKLGIQHVTADAKIEEGEARRRLFLLQVIQPGLVGLMDGSVSTLAPLFAAAFATGNTWATFLVGMAASVGAGISMGLAEGLSDDGKLTGRGTWDDKERENLAFQKDRWHRAYLTRMLAWVAIVKSGLIREQTRSPYRAATSKKYRYSQKTYLLHFASLP